MRVDRRGQFYLSGVLVPFPELLEMVYHAKRPRCERPIQGAGVVHIPDTVTRIGHRAFNSCAKLQLSRLPASLVRVGDAAFEGCAAITSLELPTKLSHLGIGALASTSLESIVIPEGVETIKPGTFANCDALKTVTLLNANTKISPHAFDVDFKVDIQRLSVLGRIRIRSR